ncbi:MAG: GNAT family N-acetyltransferase [Lachnospiraceae bacterium]|nr:GNAT family N-acetyltransferase [Candidatus Colinaster scatohippi]
MEKVAIDMENLIVRRARDDEWESAMELAFRVFLKFEAKEYGKKGTESFAEFVTSENLKKLFLTGHYDVYVATMDGKIVGVGSVRNISHISLLFVDGAYHYRGIATNIVEYMCDCLRHNTDTEYVTVNSSPYAVGFYHKLGFVDTAGKMEEDGIIYTPMRRHI